MALLSKTLRGATGPDGQQYRTFWCPGCDEAHSIPVNVKGNVGRSWGFNGDDAKPTFTPSILVTTARIPEGCEAEYESMEKPWDHPKFKWICHSFVTDGVIDFLGDCTHKLRGKVAIPDWPRPNWSDGDESPGRV